MCDTAATENWVTVSHDDIDEEWEGESMTDVEESTAEIQSTANIQSTIDADQLAEPGILWVSRPRIEEGWQEVQQVRKPGARVGECGVASRTEASIDETPDRANQGMVRDAESAPSDALRRARRGKQKEVASSPARQRSRPRMPSKACPSCRKRTEWLDGLDRVVCGGCGCEWCL